MVAVGIKDLVGFLDTSAIRFGAVAVGIKDLTTRHQLKSTVGVLDRYSTLVLGINDSTTTQEQLLGCNVLILDSATIALESVTATVIDLYVHWKPNVMLKLEAWLASVLVSVIGGVLKAFVLVECNELDASAAVGFLDTSAVRINDSRTR